MPNNTCSKTKKQRRAETASLCIKEIPEDNENYAHLAKKFPALVHTCGLVQATAFVLAKEKNNEKEKGPAIGTMYLNHLARVMGYPEGTDLHAKSRGESLLSYQQMTMEAIDSATWLKRYAEALLKDV